jgi:hypothetical protein
MELGMKNVPKTTRTAVAFIALLLCGLSEPSSALPTVSQVQTRFVKALGGASAIMRPRSMTIHAKNVLYRAGGKNIVFTSIVYLGDFKKLEIDSVPDKGRFLSGYDGNTAWAVDPGKKPQIFTGSVALSIRRDADLYYWARISQYFRSMAVVGIEPFAGHSCYRVRGITLWGNVNNQYFDVASGLLVGYQFHQWTGSAPEKAETKQVYDEYRNFSGLLISTRETDYRDGRLAGVGRYLSVEFNNIDPKVFTPPAAVRKLGRSK